MLDDTNPGAATFTGDAYADVVPSTNSTACNLIEQRDCMKADIGLHLLRIGLLCGSIAHEGHGLMWHHLACFCDNCSS